MRILAVDHGERRIGIAVSDLTGTLARALTIIEHKSLTTDTKRVLNLAREHGVQMIIVGESLDEQGQPNRAGKRARVFANALREATDAPVVMWDESLSSQEARSWRIASGATKKRRMERIDAVAAAVILQSFLDSHDAESIGGLTK